MVSGRQGAQRELLETRRKILGNQLFVAEPFAMATIVELTLVNDRTGSSALAQTSY